MKTKRINRIKRIILPVFFVLAFFALAESASAADFYVRAGASGNGSDWSNAYGSLPTTLQRGATYYIADGSYGSYSVNNVSGTELITIKKASVSDHGTNTGWQNTYGDGQALFDKSFNISAAYVVLDGGYRGNDWRSGYGIKIKTQYSQRSNKSMKISASNITVRYVEIEGSGDDDADGSNDLVYIVGNYPNLKFQYCYFQNSGRAHLLIRNAPNGLIEHCYFYKNESTSAQHSQSISAAYSVNNWVARYNKWDTIEGTGCLTIGDSGGWKVYGNVFYNYINASNGIFSGWTAEPMNGGQFYNNTIVDCNYARIGFSNDTNIVVKNNLFFNNKRNLIAGSGTRSHNSFGAGSTGTSETFGTSVQSGITASIFAGYSSRNFRLSGPTNAGDNSMGTEFNKDAFGLTRGADGVWDRGAYEYNPGGSCTPSCSNKQCGSDGCGGNCGTCPSGQSCDSSGQCQAVSCTPSWQCTAWSACENSTQTRTCTDANSCNTNDGKPNESQACSVSNIFQINDRIKIISDPSLRVRSSAGISDATILGNQPYGAQGTISGGPTVLDNYTWWQINFDNNPDGWVVEGSGTNLYIEKISSVLLADFNSDNKVDIFDYSIFTADFGKTGTGLKTDLNSDGKVDIFDYTIFTGEFGKTG
jgi:hypothetical protein